MKNLHCIIMIFISWCGVLLCSWILSGKISVKLKASQPLVKVVQTKISAIFCKYSNFPSKFYQFGNIINFTNFKKNIFMLSYLLEVCWVSGTLWIKHPNLVLFRVSPLSYNIIISTKRKSKFFLFQL